MSKPPSKMGDDELMAFVNWDEYTKLMLLWTFLTENGLTEKAERYLMNLALQEIEAGNEP